MLYTYILGRAAKLVESKFPNQGLNPGLPQCECGVLTTGLPGNSLQCNALFWPHHMACGIYNPGPGIKPRPPAGEVRSLNHWATRDVLY